MQDIKKTEYTRTAKGLHWGMALVWMISWAMGILATHWRDELNPQHGLTFFAQGAGQYIALCHCHTRCVATDAPTACLAAQPVCTDETRRNDRPCVALRNSLDCLAPFRLVLELGCGQTHPGGGPVYSAFTGESRSRSLRPGQIHSYLDLVVLWRTGRRAYLDCVEAPIYRQGQHPRWNAAKNQNATLKIRRRAANPAESADHP